MGTMYTGTTPKLKVNYYDGGSGKTGSQTYGLLNPVGKYDTSTDGTKAIGLAEKIVDAMKSSIYFSSAQITATADIAE